MPPLWRLPQPTTPLACLEAWWDLSRVPKRSFLKLAAALSPSELERERLAELAANLDDWLAYATRPKKTVVEVPSQPGKGPVEGEASEGLGGVGRLRGDSAIDTLGGHVRAVVTHSTSLFQHRLSPHAGSTGYTGPSCGRCSVSYFCFLIIT